MHGHRSRPIVQAAQEGYEDVAERLLRHGADVNAADAQASGWSGFASGVGLSWE